MLSTSRSTAIYDRKFGTKKIIIIYMLPTSHIMWMVGVAVLIFCNCDLWLRFLEKVLPIKLKFYRFNLEGQKKHCVMRMVGI